MSNLKPKFGPKVCLAPPCQAFNRTLGQNACLALLHLKLETQIRAKGLSSPTMPNLQPYIGALPHVKLETQIRAKGLSSPTMPSLQPYTWGQTLVLRSRMSNLKPKFGPKVCLAPPCQAFNLTLGQNVCFALPHVKLETQIRAKGLSSPTMPSLQAYTLGQVLRSRMSNLKPRFGPKVCLAPPCQAFNLALGQNACFALPHVKNFKPRFGPKVCLAPPCQAFNLTLGQNACFALPHVKLETRIRAKGLSSPTMPSLQPYIGAKRLFCAPACQT